MDKITPPPMPEPDEFFILGGLDWHRATKEYFDSSRAPKFALFSADQLTARDAQWLAIVKERICAHIAQALKDLGPKEKYSSDVPWEAEILGGIRALETLKETLFPAQQEET